jgi:hypothetical protein
MYLFYASQLQLYLDLRGQHAAGWVDQVADRRMHALLGDIARMLHCAVL